jgi:hypothetical protein
VTRKAALATLALLSALVLALAIGSALGDSATADEPAHIAGAYEFLVRGRLEFFPEQTPLVESLLAVPVVVAGYRFNPLTGSAWFAGHQYLYNSGYDADRIVMLARLPSIAALLALCFVVYAFVVRQSGSRLWGIAAFALTGFCPNLLAHGHLATVDIGATLLIFAASAAYIVLLQEPTLWRSIGTGALLAAAVLSKVSALILGPYFIVLLLLRIREWRRLMIPLGVALLSAVIVFESVSLFFLRDVDLLAPFVEYRERVAAISLGFSGPHGHPQFFLGEFSGEGWPHYYLVAFALKTPIAAQLLVLVALIAAFRRRAPFELRACLLFAALLMAVSARSHIAIGLRYVLPIYPFLYAAVGIALSRLRLRRFPAVLIAWHIVASIVAYPGYISYFNEAIRMRNADRYLIDSNLDWGQDLRRLARWTRREGIPSIYLHYFGGGSPHHELGSAALDWRGPRPEPLPTGWFALSRHPYRLSFLPRISSENYDDYLRRSRARYVTTIGGSINVYRVD